MYGSCIVVMERIGEHGVSLIKREGNFGGFDVQGKPPMVESVAARGCCGREIIIIIIMAFSGGGVGFRVRLVGLFSLLHLLLFFKRNFHIIIILENNFSFFKFLDFFDVFIFFRIIFKKILKTQNQYFKIKLIINYLN